MKRLYFILMLVSLVEIGYGTRVPPPNIRYRITNHINDTIDKIVQIQSDFQDFSVYDTFAVDTFISDNDLHLFYFGQSGVKKYHKLIIYVADSILESPNFIFPTGDKIGYDLIIDLDTVILERTYYFKIQKIKGNLLIAIPLFLFLKLILLAILSFKRISKIFREFLLINILYPILFYFTIDIAPRIGLFFVLVIFGLPIMIYFLERHFYSLRLKSTIDENLKVSLISGNIIAFVIGGLLIFILQVFG